MRSFFKYPGSKTLLSSWIIDHFPDHEVFVEAFGGSAALLANKPKSYNEIFNDRDGDIVHFFTTLRDRCDGLSEWCENTPYSRDLHKKYANEFYSGYRPDDDIERAGRFFYLRHTQFAQKYTDVSGFSLGIKRNQAAAYNNRVEQLHEFRDRLRHVQIENLDYAELVSRTDSEDTLFYFDPPYVEEGDDLYSHEDGFNHQRFVNTLEEIEGDWIVSYTDLPDGLENGYWYSSQDRRGSMRAGQEDWEQTNTERLVMNFNPKEEPDFAGADQSNLEAFGD